MIYADYNGSAPLNEEVVKYLRDRITDGPFANPNAIHYLGNKVLKGMEKCRQLCAEALGCKTEQVIFNSGASEGISNVFYSLLQEEDPKKNIVILSSIEHSAVLNCGNLYQKKGYQVLHLPVSSAGVIRLDILRDWLKEYFGKVALVSIMAANNETGVIQPFEEISALCRQDNIPYFSDTTQYIGKTEFNFAESNMDFAVVSGHKIGALTGSGILLAKDPSRLRPLIQGGGQENGLRGGTQNYIGNETLAIALTAFLENLNKLEEVQACRQEFEKKLKDRYPQIIILGEEAQRLAATTLVSFPGLHGQAIQIELESHDIFVTTSSACSDNEPSTSKVLKAMNVDDKVGRGVVRISVGCTSAKDNYQKIFEALCRTYDKLKNISSY